MEGRAGTYNRSIWGREGVYYGRNGVDECGTDGHVNYHCFSGGRHRRSSTEDHNRRQEREAFVSVSKRHKAVVSTVNTVSESAFRQRSLLLFFIISALLLIAGFGFFSEMMPSGVSVVEANQQVGDIRYKVIEIQKGDSLWSIARDNMNPGFDDIFDYIHELKRCNQLNSDKITAGNYLMIPYYE